MRYIVFGSGAIGCAIGAALHRVGKDVVLIGRGLQFDSIQERGLTLKTASGLQTFRIPAAQSLDALHLQKTDVVLLTVKSQDTEDAVRSLAAAAPAGISIACVQNGVENERVALRRFGNVYGVVTLLPATLLEPGVVFIPNAPIPGVLDVGRFPAGCDPTAEKIAADLSEAGFSSRATDDVMRWKYAKLIVSAQTAVNTFCRPGESRRRVAQAIRSEAQNCLRQAGIDWASDEEMAARRAIAGGGQPPGGNKGKPSLWQSLARRTGAVETDFFNGEIALLGRLYGVDCSVNAALQTLSNEMARSGAQPQTLDAETVLRRAREISKGGEPDSVEPM